MVYYIIDPLHQRIFPLQTACEFVSRNDLLRDAPMIMFGDPMAQAALKMPPNPPNILHNDCDPALERARLVATRRWGPWGCGTTSMRSSGLGFRFLIWRGWGIRCFFRRASAAVWRWNGLSRRIRRGIRFML